MDLKNIIKPGLSVRECFESLIQRYKQKDSITDKVEMINQNYPEHKAKIIRKAEQFMKGLIVLPGTMRKPYFVGSPPLWHENPVNNKEYVYSLNRMEHWPILLKAYLLTGEDKYAAEVVNQVLNWIETCPRPDLTTDLEEINERFSNTTPWRTLEVGIRGHRSWNYIIEYLAKTPLFTYELFEKMAVSMYEHAQVLYSICPLIWPNADHNHYLTENLGLLEISCIFDFFDMSDTWRTHAIKELERCVKTQIVPGGGQVEGCPTYHHECVHWLTYSLSLSKKYGFNFSKDYIDRVKSTSLYSLYSTRPDGNCVPWGDSDSDINMIYSAFYIYISLDDIMPIKQCASMFGTKIVLDVFENLLWCIENPKELYQLITDDSFTENVIFPPVRHWQKSLKQVMMRTGWDQNASSVFFACRTPVHNDHAHIDPMGFDFFAHGKAVIPDPGRYTYEEGVDRKLFKSGEYHNTLLVNNQSAFEYISTWGYGPQKEGNILNVSAFNEVQYVVAKHVNYEPVVHTRLLALIGKDILVVIDKLENMSESDTIQIYYNLNYPKAHDNGKIVYSISDDDANVALTYTSNLKPEILDGRVSTAIDEATPIKRVRLSSTASLSSTQLFATVIDVYNNELPQISDIRLDKLDGAIMIAFEINNTSYRYKWNECESTLYPILP